MTARRVLLYVQHLLGIGHPRRAAAIARALCAEGADVTFVSGGFPVPDLDIGPSRMVQLPPARAEDVSYRALVGENGERVGDAWRSRRRLMLLEALDAASPECVVLESYPFGRRLLRFELEPLLEAIPAGVRLMSSVRDVLEPRSDPIRYEDMARAVERHFDTVLVHSDPGWIPLDRTFPIASRIRERLRYTGFVTSGAHPGDAEQAEGGDEVIVSAGGGIVGRDLLDAALGARGSSRNGDAAWRVLVGPDVPERAFDELAAAAPAGVAVERNRPDFPAMLRRCRASVSQAGYNTMVDVLASGAPAVVVPFADGGEREQTLRAGLLAERGVVEVIEAGSLSPGRLARAVDAAVEAGRRPYPVVDLDGARRSAGIVLRDDPGIPA